MRRSEPESREFFKERYGRARLEANREVERRVLGHDVGLNGYTTVEQARALADHLELSPESRLLDLGAGRGWPGTFLSWLSGCPVVLADVPVEALRAARGFARSRGISELASTVSADGARLPFASRAFAAITHADVFC